MNGAAQQGIVRFAKKTVAPNTQGPQVQGSAWKLTTTAGSNGNVLSWPANSDRDNQKLHYQVFRQDKGLTTPIYETDQLSNFWTMPTMTYTDTTGAPGTVYNYRIKVIDPSGNSTQTDLTPVTTVAGTGGTPPVVTPPVVTPPVVTPPVVTPPVAPANQAPVVSIAATVIGQILSIGASATDADGTIASYAWSFGDGTTGTGRIQQHTYAAAGTYQVTVTVKDDKGAATSASKTFTVKKN